LLVKPAAPRQQRADQASARSQEMKSRCIVMILGHVLTVSWVTPASADDLSQQTGKQLYQRLCAACHGDNGEGDGTVAAYFKMRPPDLTQLANSRGGQFPTDDVRRTVDGRDSPGPHGSREMPIWGVALYYTDTKNPRQEQQVKDIVDRVVEYVRTIQKQ
jgi:mono/diheme cytochrome c family protein